MDITKINYSAAQKRLISQQLSHRTPASQIYANVSQMGRTPYRGAMQITTIKRTPISAVTSSGVGGTTLRLPAGRNVISPISGDRTGVLPTSTLATEGVFGGVNGGMGAVAPPTISASPLSIGGIGSSITSAGTGIIDMIKQYIPLAIKVILAVIVIKIVLWLVKRR